MRQSRNLLAKDPAHMPQGGTPTHSTSSIAHGVWNLESGVSTATVWDFRFTSPALPTSIQPTGLTESERVLGHTRNIALQAFAFIQIYS